MASGDGLGRVLNIIPTASGVEVNMRDAGAVTFVCVGADTYTLAESVGAGGTPQDLAAITRYHANANADGSTAWTRVPATGQTDPAVDNIVVAAGIVAFTVRAEQLTDGYTHLDVTAAATGLVYAIVHDLHVQRSAENLAPLGA